MAQVSTDYLIVTGVRAYDLNDTWYAGDNSTNNGSLGWYFQAPTISNVSVTVDVTGVQATGEVGVVSVLFQKLVIVDGVQATGAVGVVGVTGEANVNVNGVQATGAIGNVVASSRITVNIAGVQAAAAIGNVTVAGKASVAVVGVVATASLGSVSTLVLTNVAVSGVSAIASVGDVTVDAVRQALVIPVGVEAVGIVNGVNVSADSNIVIEGVVGTSFINDDLVYKLGCTTFANGVTSTGFAGALTVTTTVFDYDAVKDLYDRIRTVYVERGTTSAERTALIDGESRLVYVDSRPTRQLLVN